MVREIVVFCDVCFDGDTETRAATIELAVPATQRCTVDLCERHRAELVDPLAKLLTDHGRDVPDPVVPAKRRTGERGPGKPRNTICQLCGARVSTLDDHLRKEHREEYFRRHPEFDTERCPVCGGLYVLPYGLPMHLTRSHPDYQPPNEGKGGGGGLFMPPAQGGR